MSTPPPDWAVQYARSALRIGMRVPEIEQNLVAKGLSPEAANRLVMEIVEQALGAEPTPIGSDDRGKPVRLLLSVVVAGASLILAYWFGDGLSMGGAIIWVVPALLSVWIPDLTGMIDSDWGSRWWLCGWALLLIYLAYRIFLAVMVYFL